MKGLLLRGILRVSAISSYQAFYTAQDDIQFFPSIYHPNRYKSAQTKTAVRFLLFGYISQTCYVVSNSSTSKIKVALAGMEPVLLEP